MKKSVISILVTLFVLTINFGCKFSFADGTYLTKPDVEAKDGLISISIPRQSSDTQYINLYRKDVASDDDQIVNIGLLYPSALESTGTVYIFLDTMVVQNHTYTYMARYCESDGYYPTEWSNEVTVTGGYEETTSLKYKENGASFAVNETDYTLRLMGNILEPDIPDYEPMLIVSNGTKTQVFKIENSKNGNVQDTDESDNTEADDDVDDDADSNEEKTNILQDNLIISLRGYLPGDFLNTDVTIIGIVGQKVEKSASDDPESQDTGSVKRIFWTEPTEIRIRGYQDKTIHIPAFNGSDGVDYSRKASSIY